MSNAVRMTTDGGLARITLERPPLNVLTTAMMNELTEALESAAAAQEVHLVRLDAVGKVFSAGVDVGEHRGAELQAMMKALARLFDTLDRIAIPTVAVVHGAALGGGCELALGTDLCLASQAASFGLPEIRLGVFAPPASVLLPRIAGERRALGLLLTGETIPAARAEQLGIVNFLYPTKSFDREVDEFFDRLLQLSGAALRHAKRAVVEARGRSVEDAHRTVCELYLEELMGTEDAHEGVQAFIDKRPPRWRHR